MITPYVGGGVGIGALEVEGEGDGKFAWQLGAGVAFNLTPAVALTADYRHRQVKSQRFEEDGSGVRIGKQKTNAITAGLRFYFGGAEPMEPAYTPPPPPPEPAYVPPPPAPEPVYTPPPAPAPDVRSGERG